MELEISECDSANSQTETDAAEALLCLASLMPDTEPAVEEPVDETDYAHIPIPWPNMCKGENEDVAPINATQSINEARIFQHIESTCDTGFIQVLEKRIKATFEREMQKEHAHDVDIVFDAKRGIVKDDGPRCTTKKTRWAKLDYYRERIDYANVYPWRHDARPPYAANDLGLLALVQVNNMPLSMKAVYKTLNANFAFNFTEDKPSIRRGLTQGDKGRNHLIKVTDQPDLLGKGETQAYKLKADKLIKHYQAKFQLQADIYVHTLLGRLITGLGRNKSLAPIDKAIEVPLPKRAKRV